MIGASTPVVHRSGQPCPSLALFPRGLTGRTAAQACAVSADRPSSEERMGCARALGRRRPPWAGYEQPLDSLWAVHEGVAGLSIGNGLGCQRKNARGAARNSHRSGVRAIMGAIEGVLAGTSRLEHSCKWSLASALHG